jgi:hypothetical protein
MAHRWIVIVTVLLEAANCGPASSASPQPASRVRAIDRSISATPPASKLMAVADFDGLDFNGDVETFPLRGNGNIPPIAILSGDQTGIMNPSTVGIDATGRVYVVTGSSFQAVGISVFAPGSTGNVPPERVIVDAAQGHNYGPIAVDAAGYVYMLYSGVSGPEGIDVFPPGASGPTQPIRTITGSNTLLGTSTVDQFLVDANGGTWWESDGEVGVNQIVGYAPGANGNAAPARQIGGSRAFPTLVNSFAVDPRGHVYALDSDGIEVFGPKQNGNVRAQRLIQTEPCDCYVRMFDRALVYLVAISYHGLAGVIAYDARSRGYALPTLVMTGAKNRLTQPYGLAGQ